MSSSLWQNFIEDTQQNEHSSKYEKIQEQLIIMWKASNPQGSDAWKQLEARIYRIGNKQNQQHVCTEFCCNHPSWATEANFTGAIMDVFVNPAKCLCHVCSGANCGAKHVSTDGMSTCTISGLQFAKEKWINSFKLNHEYHRTSTSTVRVETALLKDTAKHLVRTFLFSDTRMLAEEKKLFDTQKEIRKMWVKEKREHQKNKHIPNAIHFITKAYFLKAKRSPMHYKVPDASTQEMIYEFYSQKICTIFSKLKTLTNFNIESIGPAHVTALLYLMRKGLVLNDTAIIPKDYYLETSLPTCNALDIYKINKTHFTNAKTLICSAMRDAIINGVNPHHLIVSSLQPNN